MNLVGSSVNFVHARASRVEKRDRRQPDGIFEYILSLATKKNGVTTWLDIPVTPI
jgi:hypothetical protein